MEKSFFASFFSKKEDACLPESFLPEPFLPKTCRRRPESPPE
jgi:hypothetical protein